MSDPIVSILIPNYNNGRASSRGGHRDFIADLFRSLHATLAGDPTPLEIIVADDGSTDDSLQTCREWARRTWRGGQPFCRLIELPHTGIVSRVMNRLLRESRGRIIIRFDGDVIVHTSGFAATICRAFEQGPPRLGVIGAKQLAVNGRIHSFGDWILHPRGYHHVAQGASRFAVSVPIEVDHVMGCFYCHRREVWEEIGDYDESILRGQTIDFGLRARLHGWQTICIPDVEFTHCHSERGWRENAADTEEGLSAALQAFRNKWGFDRLVPDLDVAAEKYRGTPLLWNRRVFDAVLRTGDAGESAGAPAESGNRIIEVLNAVQGALPRSGAVKICGFINPILETSLTARGLHIAKRGRLADASLIINALERHPNPIALLRDAADSTRPNGSIIIATEHRQQPIDDPRDSRHLFALHELDQFIRHSQMIQVTERAHLTADQSHIVLIGRPAGGHASHGHFITPMPKATIRC